MFFRQIIKNYTMGAWTRLGAVGRRLDIFSSLNVNVIFGKKYFYLRITSLNRILKENIGFMRKTKKIRAYMKLSETIIQGWSLPLHYVNIFKHFDKSEYLSNRHDPVCKITEKQSVGVFLTTWHCILSTLTKTHSFRLYFWRFCPLGKVTSSLIFVLLKNPTYFCSHFRDKGPDFKTDNFN